VGLGACATLSASCDAPANAANGSRVLVPSAGLHGIKSGASVRFLTLFVLGGCPVSLHNIRVVLVNTSHPGNIGGVARAMKNMGLRRLLLVEPQRFPSEEAIARASGATDVLADAQVVATLEEALAGCTLVFASSARQRHLPWPLLDPRESGLMAVARAKSGAEVALVFGREHAGLTNEELQRCHFHVHIPSDPAFSSLNLAAAVQVLSYEVRMAALGEVSAAFVPGDVEQQASAEEMESFYRHLEQSLVAIGFLDPTNPRHLMSRLRRLYGRSAVTVTEMNILRGVLTETVKAARGEHHRRGK
jgi:TrmH family RNA methyltransferase